MGQKRTPGSIKMLTWFEMCLDLCRAMWNIYQAISHSCWVSLKKQQACGLLGTMSLVFNGKILLSLCFFCSTTYYYRLCKQAQICFSFGGCFYRKEWYQVKKGNTWFFFLLASLSHVLLISWLYSFLAQTSSPISQGHRAIELRKVKDFGNHRIQLPHFTVKETEAQWGEMSCLDHTSREWQVPHQNALASVLPTDHHSSPDHCSALFSLST